MIPVAFGLVLPVAATYLLLRALSPRFRDEPAWLGVAIAIAFGLGLASVVAFWCIRFRVAIGPAYALGDAILWVAIGVVAWWRQPARDTAVAAHGAGTGGRLDLWAARAAFAVAAALALITIGVHYGKAPHGEWDAWAIWNLKARFFVRDLYPFERMLPVSWSQPGHPFFVGLSVARLWAYADAEPTLVPAVLGLLWAGGIAAAIIGALGPARPRAWVAAAVLLAPATFTQQAAAQTADLAASLFVLLTLVMVWRATAPSAVDAARASSALLAGLLAGFAAWTKNEGFLLVAIATVVLAMALPRRQGWMRQMSAWVAGVVPLCATGVWFKMAIAPVSPGYVNAEDSPVTVLARFVDPSRYLAVKEALGWRWLEWGGPAAAGALPLLFAAAIAAVATRGGRSMWPVLAASTLMLAAFYVVWLVTPLDTAWLLSTTFDRLMIQIWPSLVLVAFSAGTTPSEAA
jgi:hypothetical protein